MAKDLLSEDGVIFISIDDNEAANLTKVCNEVFGSESFVADIAWQRTYSPRNDSQGISYEKEHLIVYGKQANWNPKKLPRTDKMDSKYKNPDNDESPWRTSDAFAPNAVTHQGMVYAIQNPFNGEMIYPYKGACWPLRQSDMLSIMQEWGQYELRDLHDSVERANVCGIQPSEVREGVLGIVLATDLETAKQYAVAIQERGQWPRFFFTKGGQGGIARKTYLKDTDGRVVTNFWPHAEVGHTDEAKKEVKNLFEGSAPFDTPKPIRFIERMLHIATDSDSLVLDFFSGSATTAHAVMQKNASDGGNRKFIMVQLPEPSKSPKYCNLCEIGKERIRRAGQKIKESCEPLSPLEMYGLDYTSPDYGKKTYELKSDAKECPDIGFRVLRLDSSNMQDVYYTPDATPQDLLSATADNIKPDRTPEDLLFQVMLELGVLPSSKIAEIEIAGKRVFDVADGFLLACFDAGVTTETVTAIAQRQPYYAVFRDSSMADDSTATNFDQIFETYSPSTVRKVL